MFNDLRRKLANRSKKLVNLKDFFCSFKKRTIKFDLDLKWYLSQYQWSGETQNIKWLISHNDFRTGCDPPLPLFIIQKGGGVTPQNEIRWRNQITWTEVSISNHDFGMGCDPPLLTTLTSPSISHYDFGMGCDPPSLSKEQRGSHPILKS